MSVSPRIEIGEMEMKMPQYLESHMAQSAATTWSMGDKIHGLDEQAPLTGHQSVLRVLVLMRGTTVPASRFRVQQWLPHLERRGIEVTVRPAYGDAYNRMTNTALGPAYKLWCSLKRLPQLVDAHRFDVVVIQKPTLPFSALPEVVASWKNPRLVFDVDDAVYAGEGGAMEERRQAVFEAIVERCEHVICGNVHLAQAVGKAAPTTVIPTVVDTDLYRPSLYRRGEETLTIGWMGTAANFDSLEMIAEPLRRLARRPDVEVELVSNARFEPLAGVGGVIQKRWSAGREVVDLQGFDIGVMPLVDTEVTRGKCGFKAIQYMAVGVPVVASPVGVNAEVVGQKESVAGGVMACDSEAFEAQLEALIDDGQRRRRLGAQGRQRVEERYSIAAVVDRYVEVLRGVGSQVGAAG